MPRPPSREQEEEEWRDPLDEQTESGLADKTNQLSLETTATAEPLPEEVNGNNFNLVQSPTSISTSSSTLSPDSEKSKWKAVWEESRHFMGGLIRHPYESTKHYTILRHSNGLVYYKGATTSIAITIFADRLLLPGRRLWLQNKGWSGNRGMRVKAALRVNNSWIDVTPAMQVEASALLETNERAWQRDIGHFLKKASSSKSLQEHKIRETDVVRIPHEAQDGYFRIALTGPDDQKVLCASPIFRVASTSMSASSIRGASLSTLPIELSIKAGSMIAKSMGSNAISPVTDSLQGQVQQYVPSYAQTVSTTAYDISGVSDKVESLNEQYDQTREKFADPTRTIKTTDDEESREPHPIGDPSDPQLPFPIKVRSKVVSGTGRGYSELDFPTANLKTPPHELPVRLRGTYFGWASTTNAANNTTAATNDDDNNDGNDNDNDNDEKKSITKTWNPALITVGVCPYAKPSVAPREVIKVHFITNSGDGGRPSSPSSSPSVQEHRPGDFPSLPTPLLNVPPSSALTLTVTALILSPLPFPSSSSCPSPFPTTPASLAPAIQTARLSLSPSDRPGWSAATVLQTLSERKKARSFNERYVDVRAKGNKWMERVPVQRMGVRTNSAGGRERLVVIGDGVGGEVGKKAQKGGGGLWVKREEG